MIDQKEFLKNVVKERLFLKLWPGQAEGLTALLTEWERLGFPDTRWLAYVLATVYHETAYAMQPIEERGKGVGKRYGIADPVTGLVYYGRGLTQTTWIDNYRKLTKANNRKWDFVKNPELLLQMEQSVWATFHSMVTGLYTGMRLNNYIKDGRCDFVQARRIINGMDCASKIADYAVRFSVAINNSTGVNA